MRNFRIYSIPHTGTRFVRAFFQYQGFAPEYVHAGSAITDDLLLVIPKRSPLDCYYSHASEPGFDLGRFVGWWHELIFRSQQENAFAFPIAQKSEAVELAVCEFVDIPHLPGFDWQPVGATNGSKNPKDYPDVSIAMRFAMNWYGNQ